MRQMASPAIVTVCALVMLSANLNAQGRGGATPPVPPPSDAYAALPADMIGLLTAAQQAALGRLVAAAEEALAMARADQLAKLHAAKPLTPEQRTAAIGRINAAGGRGGLIPPRSAEDAEGFVSIFDGKTLANWDGDPTFWRAEDGMIVGESTPEKVAGRQIMAPRGQFVRAMGDGVYKYIATVADPNELPATLAINDLEGLLGFQMHVGPPFKVQYRNVLYKPL